MPLAIGSMFLAPGLSAALAPSLGAVGAGADFHAAIDQPGFARLYRHDVNALGLGRVAEFDRTHAAVIPCHFHTQHFNVKVTRASVIGYRIGQMIDGGGARKAARALRDVSLSSAKLVLTAIENQANADVRLARASVDALTRVAASSRASAAQAREVLTITNAAFGLGASTNLEVIDAERSVRDAEATAVVADDAVRQARLLLLVALGRFPR